MENCIAFRDDEPLTVEPVKFDVALTLIRHDVSENEAPDYCYRIEQNGQEIFSFDGRWATVCRAFDCELLLEDLLDPNAT